MKKLFTLLLTVLWIAGYSQTVVYIDEGFDSNIPATWSTDSEIDAFPWIWKATDAGNILVDSGFVMVDSDADGNGFHMIENLETPGFDASAGNIIIVEFTQYYNAIGSDSAAVQVWDGTSWNTVWSADTDIGGWIGGFTQDPINTTIIITDDVNLSGDTKVRFHYDDANVWAWWWAIDNVVISSVDCLAPLNAMVTQLGAISTQVSWDSGSGTSDLAYGPAGFDINDIVATGGTLVTGASNPYDISGLSPETDYEFYVMDDCGVDGMSPWAGPVAFTTTVGCPDVVFNGFSNPAATSMDIAFTQGFGDVYVIYGEPGFILGSAGDTVFAGTSPFTLDGLTDLTFYDVYLFMDCEGDGLGFSNNVGPYSFNTLVDGPGTTCLDPIVLGSLPYSEVGSTFCGYGNNIQYSNCFNFTSTTDEVIFAYSPTTDGEIIAISLANISGNYAFVSILDGCPDDVDATCIASGSSGFDNPEMLIDGIELVNGTIYYIMISTYSWNDCLTYDLVIQGITCATPELLSATSNSDGSAELTWTSMSAATNFQIEWGVTGFLPGEGTEVNGEYGVDGPPVTITGLTSENNYEFYVIDLCGIGDFSLPSVRYEFSGPPPANDQCADAISIACGDIVTGNTAAATTTGNPEDFCGTNLSAASVWYSFVGTGDDVTLSTDGSDYDTKLHLFSGDCDNLVCVDGDDDGGAGLQSYIYANTVVGETYYVIVSGFSSSTGLYTLEYNCITCGLISGLTVGATDVSATANWVTSNTGATYSVEYGPVGFTQGTGTDITGTVGTDGPPVDITGLTAGATYDVYVYEICEPGDTNQTLEAEFTTNLLPPPGNDLCSNAYPIACGGSDSGSTVDATQIGNPLGSLCGFSTLNSNAVWYTFVGNGQLTAIDLCGSDFDTELFVFTGDCDSLECYVVADGNGGNCTGWQQSYTEFFAEDGVTYYIAIAGWWVTYSGNYVISMECTACGDPSAPSVSVTDVSATLSWDTYLPGADYTLAWGASGTDLWVDGTIVTGNNNDLPVQLTGLLAGETYDVCFYEYCAADAVNTDTLCFSFTTNLLPPPANDNICDAVDLVEGEVLETSNLYATTQFDEPIPPATGCADPNQMGWCNSNISNSTWYTYTPASDGVATISTCHVGSYDTQLAVYTGDCNDLANLVLVAANDDQIGGCSDATWASTVNVCVESGVTYYIQVDPYSSFGNGGDFLISADLSVISATNVVAISDGSSASITWDYTNDLGDVDFTLVYVNTNNGDSLSMTGNTAELPVLLTGLADGNYEFYIYMNDDCNTTVGPLSFDVLDGINELNFDHNVTVYPNPVKDKLIIEVNADLSAGTTISIISLQGKVVYMESVKENTSDFRTEIDVDNYARGMYLLRLEDENSSIQQRIIVQ